MLDKRHSCPCWFNAVVINTTSEWGKLYWFSGFTRSVCFNVWGDVDFVGKFQDADIKSVLYVIQCLGVFTIGHKRHRKTFSTETTSSGNSAIRKKWQNHRHSNLQNESGATCILIIYLLDLRYKTTGWYTHKEQFLICKLRYWSVF